MIEHPTPTGTANAGAVTATTNEVADLRTASVGAAETTRPAEQLAWFTQPGGANERSNPHASLTSVPLTVDPSMRTAVGTPALVARTPFHEAAHDSEALTSTCWAESQRPLSWMFLRWSSWRSVPVPMNVTEYVGAVAARADAVRAPAATRSARAVLTPPLYLFLKEKRFSIDNLANQWVKITSEDMMDAAAGQLCARARFWASLRVDAELSELESALLDSHLARCASCRDYAESVAGSTRLLRAQALVVPQQVALPRRRGVGRGMIAAATAALAIVAAALGGLVGGSVGTATTSTAAVRNVAVVSTVETADQLRRLRRTALLNTRALPREVRGEPY